MTYKLKHPYLSQDCSARKHPFPIETQLWSVNTLDNRNKHTITTNLFFFFEKYQTNHVFQSRNRSLLIKQKKIKHPQNTNETKLPKQWNKQLSFNLFSQSKLDMKFEWYMFYCTPRLTWTSLLLWFFRISHT